MQNLLPEHLWPKHLETTMETAVNKRISLPYMTAAVEKRLVLDNHLEKGTPSKHLVTAGMCWRHITIRTPPWLLRIKIEKYG